MDLFCEAFKPVFPFSLLFSLQLFRVLSSSLFWSSHGQVSVGLFSSIVYLVGLFNQFWGIFLKHFFDFTILFFQNSYYPDGGPSRLVPQFLFSLFHLFAFFPPLGNSSSLSSNAYVAFFIYVIFLIFKSSFFLSECSLYLK